MLPAEQIDRLAGRDVHNSVVVELSESGHGDFDIDDTQIREICDVWSSERTE